MEGLSLITCRDNISPLPTGSIFSTKEKLLWILCDHLGRIVFVIIQYTIQSVLLNNNKFWACDQYHRKYTESCLQHHWCQWVYCSRKTAETNQQKNITTYFAMWKQCSSNNLFPSHGTLCRRSFGLPCVSCCLYLLLWQPWRAQSHKQCLCSQACAVQACTPRHSTGMWCVYCNTIK